MLWSVLQSQPYKVSSRLRSLLFCVLTQSMLVVVYHCFKDSLLVPSSGLPSPFIEYIGSC